MCLGEDDGLGSAARPHAAAHCGPSEAAAPGLSFAGILPAQQKDCASSSIDVLHTALPVPSAGPQIRHLRDEGDMPEKQKKLKVGAAPSRHGSSDGAEELNAEEKMKASRDRNRE
jgi:hypothetical protein